MHPDGLVRTALGHWLVAGDTGVSASVLSACTFDHPQNLKQIAAVAHCIPEGSVVVEAGACIGDQTTIYSRMVGPAGRVYAFEPHPTAYQALCLNTVSLLNISVYPKALGAGVESVMPFTPVPTNLGASYLGLEMRFTAVESDPVDVAMTTLDTILGHLGRLDFIHLDAEGMESQILTGAETLIQRFHPALLVEVTDAWLRQYGSSCRDLLQQIAGYGYFAMVQLEPNPAQFDILCLHGALRETLITPLEATLAGHK